MTTMTTAAGRRQVRGKSTTGAHARSQSPSHVRTSKYRAHHPRANCKVGHQSPSPEMNQNQNPENKLRRSSARLASQNQQNKKRKCLDSFCNCDELVVSPAPAPKKKRKSEAQNDDGNGNGTDDNGKAGQAPKQKQQHVNKRISTTKHPKQQPQPTSNSSAQHQPMMEVVEVQRSSSRRRQQQKTKPSGRGGGETRKTVVSHAVVPYKQKKGKKMPSPKPEAQSQKRAVFLHFLVQLIEDRQVEEAIRMLELNWGDLFTGQHPMLHIRLLKLGFLDALNAANDNINNNDDGQEEDEQMEQDEEEENHQPQQKQQQKLAVDQQQAALNMRKAVALGREAKRQLDSLVANSTRTGSLKHRQTIGELQRSLQQIWVDDLDEEQENGLVDDRKQIAAQLSQIIGQTQMLAFE